MAALARRPPARRPAPAAATTRSSSSAPGLAGSSAAATLAGQGYKVERFCFQDSARRAHSIAAQGGINATKDYANEGDSVHRLFVDTIKGGDFRAREANVWRLAELSTNIIDQAVAQGVPVQPRVRRHARDPLASAACSSSAPSTAAARPASSSCSAPTERCRTRSPTARRRSTRATRCSTSSSSTAQARGIIARNLVTGEIERYAADAVVLATGGYCNVYYLSTNAMGCNVTAIWRAHKRGAAFANPCFTQIHPTCIPAVRRLPVEADPDERVAAQRRPDLGPAQGEDDERAARGHPRGRALLLPRGALPALRQPRPPRRRLARGEDRLRRRPGRRRDRPRRLPRLPRRDRGARARRRSTAATGTSSRCTSGSPATAPGRRR